VRVSDAAADAAAEEMIKRMMMRRQRLVERFFMQVEAVAVVVAVVGGLSLRCERVSSLAMSVASSCLGMLSSFISKPLTNGKKQRLRWHYYFFNYIKIAKICLI